MKKAFIATSFFNFYPPEVVMDVRPAIEIEPVPPSPRAGGSSHPQGRLRGPPLPSCRNLLVTPMRFVEDSSLLHPRPPEACASGDEGQVLGP